MARRLLLLVVASAALTACLLDTQGRLQRDADADGDGDECAPAEECNGEDDDCDGEIDEDEEVSVTGTDPHNCGRCGHECRDANATSAACADGQCVFECGDGYAFCPDPSRVPVCDSITSDTRCGDCDTSCNRDGRVCSTAGGTPHCVNP